MPVFEMPVETMKNLFGIYNVTGVGPLNQTQKKRRGAPAVFDWFNIELEPQYNAPKVRKMIMVDLGMFQGDNVIGDFENYLHENLGGYERQHHMKLGDLYQKFRKDFRNAKENWAQFDDFGHYLACRANNWSENVQKKEKGYSVLQAIFGNRNYRSFLASLDEQGDDLTMEFIHNAIAATIEDADEAPQVLVNLRQGSEKNEDGSKSLTRFYEASGFSHIEDPKNDPGILYAQKRVAAYEDAAENPTDENERMRRYPIGCTWEFGE